MTEQSMTGYALITGASSGIGEAIAREYAVRGVPLILTARRLARLDALAAELRVRVPVEVIAADLADPAAPMRIIEELRRRGVAVRILVNNAGYGVPGRFLGQDWVTHAAFLQVMIGAVGELTWRLLPEMRASGAGRILNVASVAGLMPGADGQTLYAAVKSWMVRFSESLALEYAQSGVRVTALCPGFTRSEFHDVTKTRDLMDSMPGWFWLSAEEVARAGIEAVERGQIIVVPGWRYRLLCLILRLMPHAWVMRLIRRNSGKFRRAE